ncbi:hypothetical protein VZQ01_09650 [Myxococcus faecalis]|uniref:hypothetical protein n=1 Tax=Myxococcus faecalis TaxID=3115646 RepID=UPI003CF0D9FB
MRQAMQGHQERIKDPAYELTASISMSLMYVSGPGYLEEPHHSSTCMPMAKESMAIAQSVVRARHDEIRKRMVEQCKRIVRLPTHHQERSALGEIKRNIKTMTDDMPRSSFEPGEYDECGEWMPRELGR